MDVVFRRLDRGVEGDVQQDYAPALPPAEALRDEVLVAHTMNGMPLLPQMGFRRA